MLTLTSEQREAIESRRVMHRFFVWCDAVDPDTGDPDPAGFWNDVGNVEVSGRTYHGALALIGISPLGGKGDMSIPGLEVTFSGLDAAVNDLARARGVAQAPLTVKIGIFDADTHTLIPPLIDYFDGFVDDGVIKTPASGGETTISFICESASRALTRISTATRSHASEVERDADDQFYLYTGAVRVPVYFGKLAPAQVSVSGQGGGGFAGSIARA